MGEQQVNISASEQDKQSSLHWLRLLGKVRSEVASAVEYGATAGKLTSLIALAGLLYWCPRCGQWMGAGSEGKGSAAPSEAPPVPQRLLRAISSPLAETPTPLADQPKRDGNRLTQNSGVLEGYATFRGVASKVRHRPPSNAHGRKVENLYGGSPKPDSGEHAHEASFVRGDGEAIPIYDRSKDGGVEYESGVKVRFDIQSGEYIWSPIITSPNNGNGPL